VLSYFYPEKGGKVVTQLLRRSSPKLELWKTLRVESAKINAGRGEVPGDIGEEDRGKERTDGIYWQRGSDERNRCHGEEARLIGSMTVGDCLYCDKLEHIAAIDLLHGRGKQGSFQGLRGIENVGK